MDRIWLFFTIFLDVYPFILLQYLPFRDSLKWSYKKTMLFCFAVLSLQFLGFLWLNEQPFCSAGIMMLYRFGLLLTLLFLTLFLVRDKIFKVLFIFGLMAPYVAVTISAGSFLRDLLWQPEMPPYMMSVLCRFGLISVSFPILYLVVKNFLVPLMNTYHNSIWKFAFPIPLLFSLISLSFMKSDYEENGVLLSDLMGMTFIFLGCLFICFFLLAALRQTRETTELAAREEQTLRLLTMQQEQYERIVDNMSAVKAARHDLRHHLSVIHTLLKEDRSAELLRYIDEYAGSVPLFEELAICEENCAVNSIASYYVSLARSQGIHVRISVKIGTSDRISDADLSIVLGNCMENAIEGALTAPENERFIKVIVRPVGGRLSIVIDNSFDGILALDSGEIMSRKRDGLLKGVGLASVSAVVKRLNGLMKTEHDENLFQVSILLPL